MKSKLLALFLLLLGLLAVAVPRTAPAQDAADQGGGDGPSFKFFYDALAPYGEWVQVGNYGLCWHPAGVDPNWAPYTDGYWAYTDGGWTWVSYEDYGGIVYHYGRWVETDEEGWCWVPDYEWAPAWVSWRNNDDYVGWAPLPPEAQWQPDVGVSVWADTSYDIGPGCYHFCHYADFGAPVISAVLLPRAENVTIIANTVNITNITFNRGAGFIFVGGPRYDLVVARVGRPIPSLRLVRQTNITNVFVAGKRPFIESAQRGNALFITAPRVRPPANPRALLATFKPAKVIEASKIKHGWNVVANPEAREQLRVKLQAQTKGLTPQSSPAKPVLPGELKTIPREVDTKAVVGNERGRPPGKVVGGGPGAVREGEPVIRTKPGQPAVIPGETGITSGPGTGKKFREPGVNPGKPEVVPGEPAITGAPERGKKVREPGVNPGGPTEVAPPNKVIRDENLAREREQGAEAGKGKGGGDAALIEQRKLQQQQLELEKRKQAGDGEKRKQPDAGQLEERKQQELEQEKRKQSERSGPPAGQNPGKGNPNQPSKGKKLTPEEAAALQGH